MTHFHVGHNMPGYMPDEAPYCTDSADHALTVWREEIRRHIESLEDDGAFLEADTRQELDHRFGRAGGCNPERGKRAVLD